MTPTPTPQFATVLPKPETMPANADLQATASSASSEAAELIARLIPVLPERTVVELGRLLQRRLTSFDHQATRYARLGLLIDIVSAGTGELPSTRDYEAERGRRAKAGETDWPTHSTLSVAYGGWVRAVRAAMLLWRDGSGSRVAHSNHHARFERAYRHQEAVAALVACNDALDEWPDEWVYDEWRRVARELARNAGLPYPRYPSRDVWRKLFGDWDAFTDRAKRAARANEEG